MSLKRWLDILVSGVGLFLVSPVLLPVIFILWKQDLHSPFYIAPRVGKDGLPFRMVKLRSMVVNADRAGIDSTSSDDQRITPAGHFIRRYKLDELIQLWNVLTGDMSLVGPRPNVKRETDYYTGLEMKLLDVKPGLTDFASIVFADEGSILKGSDDPDLQYNQLIRPWKSRLGLFYIEHQKLAVDLQLIYLTALVIVSRKRGLQGVQRLLQKLEADSKLVKVAGREEPLLPHPPPGSYEVIFSNRFNS